MATDNTLFINQFTKGMNTDVSYQMLSNDTYSYAENIRIFSVDDAGVANKYGEVRSIEGVKIVYDSTLTDVYGNELELGSIKAACSIRDYGILVIEENVDNTHPWHIVVFKNKILDNENFISDTITAEDIKTIYSSWDRSGTFDDNKRLGGVNGVDKVSVVTRFETDENIKLYIADGEHYIFVFNIVDDTYNKDVSGDIDKIQIYPRHNFGKIFFTGLISGNLKPSVVQYSYRLYNNNGVSSEMSVPTRLIPIVYSKSGDFTDGNTIFGGNVDDEMGVGVSLRIKIQSDINFMDRILVYRIQYLENGQVPQIDLISDFKYTVDEDNDVIQFSDTGLESLQTLTVDEYNSLSGVHIVPKVIESMNDYMFAANIRSEGGFTNDIFQDFDARSYRYNRNNRALIYPYGADSKKQIDDNYDSVAKDHDCYNKYNDMRTLFREWNDDEATSCRFTRSENGTQYYGGTGKYVSWKFVITELVGDSTKTKFYSSYDTDFGDFTGGGNFNGSRAGSTGNRYYVGFNDNIINYDKNHVSTNVTSYYITSNGSPVTAPDFDLSRYIYDEYDGTNSYVDPQIIYSMKSLKRDELYRYGIILYDEQGNASFAKWIADIRTPNLNYKGFETYRANVNNNNGDRVNLIVRPLGIEFTVDIDKYNNEEGHDVKIASYEIVRCNRTEQDVVNIAQGVISRPIQRKLNRQANNVRVQNFAYTPTGLLTVANFASCIEQIRFNRSSGSGEESYEADNYDNYGVYQFVSPEILYAKDSTYELISNSSTSLVPMRLIYGQDLNYQPSSQIYTVNRRQPGEIRPEEVKFIGVSTALSNMNMPLAANDESYQVSVSDGETYKGYGISSGRNRSLSIRETPEISPASYFWRYFGDCRIYDDRGTDIGSNIHSNDWYYYYYLPGHCEPQDVVKSVIYGQRIYDGTKYISSYSKLYEQADRVLLRKYPELEVRRRGILAIDEDDGSQADLTADQQQELMNNVIGYPNGYDVVDLSVQYSYQIADAQLADELSWNDFLKSETNDNRTTYSYPYIDHQNSIFSSPYCNFVSGPAYNASIMTESDSFVDNTSNNINSGNVEDGNRNNIDNFLFGTGGRCLLIGLSDADNIIFKTIGTDIIKYYANSVEDELSVWDLKDTNQELSLEDVGGVYQAETDSEPEDYVMLNSILSTYLCNIRKNTTPYNSYTYTNRSLDTYYSYGDIFSSDQQSNIIFDGDCVIMPMEYVSIHKVYPQTTARYVTSCFIYSIPVETSVLLGYTHGFEYSKNYNNPGISNIQIEPANVNNIYTQSDPLYTYNSVYSTNPTVKMYAALRDDEDDNSLTQIDYRCYHSNQKSNNESIDSWTTFLPANYLDVDTRFGQISNLRRFDNKLLFWQENALGAFSVNERSQITDDNDNVITLGTAGILARYDYLDQTSGMHIEEYNDKQSASAIYWYDSHNKELKQYSQTIYLLNKIYGTENLINNKGDINPVLFYDDKYQELVGNVLSEGNSLAFSEQNKMFTSVYTVPFEESIKFTNGIYLVQTEDNNIQIAQWGVKENNTPVDLNNNTLHTKIEYTVNPSVSYTKVFDDQEIITPNRLYTDEQLPCDYFDQNHVYSWKTDLGYTSTGNLNTTCREGNFRYAIPRSGNATYGNRMRGKYMVCTIEDVANNENAAISYIMTKYRISWI